MAVAMLPPPMKAMHVSSICMAGSLVGVGVPAGWDNRPR
jgi:hypothetical protein